MTENRYIKDQGSKQNEAGVLDALLSSAKLLFADFREPVLLIDLEGRLIYCNKATEILGGFTSAELHGRFLHEQHINPAFAAKVIIPAVQKEGYWTGEIIVGDKTGREFPVLVSASPVKEQKGKPLAIGVLVRDMSGRAQIEEEMARYLKDLEFLSDSASQFLRQESLKDLYEFIGRQLRSLAGRSIVAVSDYDPVTSLMSVRNALGPRSALDKFSDVFGQSFTGLALKTDTETRQWMRQGILAKVSDINTLFFKQIPGSASKRIEENLELGDIYAMPLVSGRELLGTIAILTRKNEVLTNRYLIEIFVNQASIALKQRKVEDKLRDSEQQFRAIFEDASTGIVLSDVDRHPLETNTTFQKMLGFSKEELQKMTFNDFTHPLDQALGDRLQDKLKRGKLNRYRLEKRYVRKDGKEVWVDLRVSAIKDPKGRPKFTVGVISDITRRKQTEEALRKSEERYALAQREANIGSWDWDIKTGDLQWSEQVGPMFGFKKGEFKATYESFLDCVHPQDRQSVVDSVQNCLENGTNYDIEHRIVWSDGTIRWVSETGNVVRSEKGKPARMVGIVQDITEHKVVDQALRESEAKFRAVTQSANDAIITSDKSGRILSWNRGAEIIFGYDDEEVLKKPLAILIPEVYRAAHQKALKNFNPERSRVVGKTIEVHGIRKDGSIFPVELSLSSWEVGKKLYFTAIIRDITERKELEQRKDEFISIASHELKTPLTSIKVFAQILQKRITNDKDEQSQYLLSRLDNQVNKLTDLIVELLDATKIQSGKLEFKKEWFSMDDLVKEVVSDVQVSLESKHKIFLQGRIRKMVEGDKYRMAQVLSNLLMNAVAYSPNADKIIVRLFSTSKKVQVSVQDFGIGIPEDKQKHIFERFYQAHTGVEAKGRFSSLGLGLYISSEIVKRHDGEMWLLSEEGKGSTFYFSLPLVPKTGHKKS